MHRRQLLAALALLPLAGACARERVGGPCDGCDLAHEGMPATLASSLALTTPAEPGEPLVLTGIVLAPDARTPARDIVLYAYQTSAAGRYERGPGAVRRHGRLRGWLRTGADGRYEIRTIRPGAYPGESIPEHIHITVIEPGLNEYYIDDVNFDDDPLLDAAARSRLEGRGGSGVVRLTRRDGTWHGVRDIVLGHAIANHPGATR